MLLFALNASRAFGSSIASALGVRLSLHEEHSFEDGEHETRPSVEVRGTDVCVVQSLHHGADQTLSDRLSRLLFFLATLHDHGAASLTAVVPYLAYARKDRRTAPYDSVSSRYLAQLFEAVGTDMLLTLEVHNPAAFDNAFRCRTIRLDSSLLFEDAAVALDDGGRLVVVSPDPGGIKRARSWREALEKRIGRSVGQAFVDKSRRAGVVAGSPIVVGDVADATLLVFDDMISTGTTMARATCALKDAGARRIFAFTAHGLFVAEAPTLLSSAPIDRMFVSDTILPLHLPSNGIGWRTEVISAAPLFATAIRQQSTTGM